MKKQTGRNERGFTLIELLMVAAILGIVMGAMYSLYTTHQRTAYTSDETVEVQQNLRIAIDSISRDLRKAGFLLQTDITGTYPISTGSTSTMIYIGSGCPSGIITRLSAPHLGNTGTNSFTVDTDGSVSAFNNGDKVRIINPSLKTQPSVTAGVVQPDRIFQVASTPSTSSINLTIATGTDPTNVQYKVGDVICKVLSASPAPPNKIQYYLATGGTCPAGQVCLIRLDETGTPNVVAQNMSSIGNGLQFQYLLDGYLLNETSAPTTTTVSKIRAVRVTVTGQTAATVGLSGNVPKTRQMETLVQIRNR